jgi:uncharacterized membrane protein
MSLKAIHILFIAASLTLCFGFAAWAFWMYSTTEYDRQTNLVMGVVSSLIGVALMIYGKYFLRKLKDVSYL